MDEFDISLDGYTPTENESMRQRSPYRPPMGTGTYHPPVEDEPYRPPREPDTETPHVRRDPQSPRPTREQRFQSAPQPTTVDVPQPTAEERDKEREQKAQERKAAREKRIAELKRQRAEDDRPNIIVRFFTDERMRIFLGLALIILSVFILIAVCSHFGHGAKDQSVVANLPSTAWQEDPNLINNAAGGFGAWLSKLLLCDTLGLGALVLIPYLWVVSLALLGMRKCSFWATTFRCLLLAIATSIVLGFFTYNSATIVYWGGDHGHYVNKFLIDNTTWLGALAVTLILICAVCCVYLNELRNGWRKWRAVYKRHKIQEELRRERRHELEMLEAEEAEAAKKERVQTANEEEKESAPHILDLSDGQEITVDEKSGNKLYTTTEQLGEEDGLLIETDNETPTKEHGLLQIEDVTKQQANDIDSGCLIIDPSAEEPIKVDDNFTITAPTLEKADAETVEIEATDNGNYDHRALLAHYQFPPVELLEDRPSGPNIDLEEQMANKAMIEKTLLDYKIPISRIEATVGPTVTLYEIVPAEGVRISQIKRLEDDIALSLKALGIRIIAPIPGKGTVGIEVPNNDPKTVSMRSVIESKKFQECKMALPMAMGATISNDIFIADMAKMPHLLVAGATGMGKSVGLNAIIASFLYKKHPSELKLVLIDPKMVEFSLYSRLDHHFLAKLPNEEDAIITDMKKVIQTLNSLCIEMDERYELLRDANVRSLEEYNKKFTERRLSTANGHKYLPYIVVIVDEFADLIMTQGKEIEQPIARIAQKARAVGIHMILATQRPSTNVITGLIKANFPGRIAFRVIQMVDSRTILDQPGANQLIGRGDMLFSHNGIMQRVQCAFISTEEVEALTEYIDKQVGYEHAYYLPEYVPEEAEGGAAIAGGSMERDSLFNEAARFVVTRQLGSTSSLQRQFGIGYNRAGKLMDQMEAAGIVGPVNGAKPRSILMDIVTLESILGD